MTPHAETQVVTPADLVAGLQRLGVGHGDTVLVHASLRSFGHFEGGAEGVIDGVLEAIGPSGTVVFPAFTWRRYHATTEPIEFHLATEEVREDVGQVPETFRRRPGVRRSLHLCHSVCALGPHSERVMGDGVRAWGPGSSFEVLEQLNAWNLLLGAGVNSLTAIHHAEDLVQVPYRQDRDYPGCEFVLPEGQRVPCRSVEFVRLPGTAGDLRRMEQPLVNAGVLRTTMVGPSRVRGVRMQELVRVATGVLRAHAEFLVVG